VFCWVGVALVGASKNLVKKLETKFPTHGVMDVIGIMYPQYWIDMHKL
jgi:carbamoylphosphate synthase large subunit